MKKALALSLALSVSAFAADNLFEVTPQIGGSFHIDSDKYSDSENLSYGLKFANRVTPSMLVELGYDRVENADYIPNFGKTDANRFYMNLVKEFHTESTFSPYILGGLGYENLTNNALSMDDDIFGQYGVGLRQEVTDFLHLKAEIRHLLSFDGRSDIVAMLGFSIPFGKYANNVATTAADTTEAQAPSHIHTFSVQFPFDSAYIAPSYNTEISNFATSLKENPKQNAIINGHTDAQGSEAYNQKLSLERANAVKDAIVAEGVAEDRLQTKGYGESQPIADNATKEGRQKNRRVEAEIYTTK